LDGEALSHPTSPRSTDCECGLNPRHRLEGPATAIWRILRESGGSPMDVLKSSGN
jgi:hypothetical protein